MMLRLRRTGLMAAMTVVGLNICTGNPLLALWVGSRVVGGGTLTMGAVGLVAAMMGVVGLALAQLLAWLGAAYDRASGRTSSVRTHVPWLRSMRSQRGEEGRGRAGAPGMGEGLLALGGPSRPRFQ